MTRTIKNKYYVGIKKKDVPFSNKEKNPIIIFFQFLANLLFGNPSNSRVSPIVEIRKSQSNDTEGGNDTLAKKHISRRFSDSGIDFDKEGRKLLASMLNLKTLNSSNWDNLNAIWRNPHTGGVIYVGDNHCAKNINSIRSYNITHIVNCTHGPTQLPNYHEKDKSIIYLNFEVYSLFKILIILIAFIDFLLLFLDLLLGRIRR